MNMTFKSLKFVASILLISLVLVSCGNKQQLKRGVVLVSNCPAVGVIDHLNSITRFNGKGQTNADVVFDANITNLEAKCSEGSSVATEISFSIRAKKGVAFEGQSHVLSYYVVVLRDSHMITHKKVYTTRINFKPGSDTAGVREVLVQTFNNFEEPRRYDYEVLVGFEVTPEELQFNVVR
jgi:hypothetical protein